ncbi:MAG: hydroxymethylglutaryl-CoA lyase [Acidobacteria bacterium]|nr:hydroxymethylglutaryl-CoA lyase [Acidobacteriota bacterium]
MSARPSRVTIVEVGPRDGLQNEPALIDTASKIALIDGLAAAGHTRIEAAAFVSPKWVPQMGDAAAVFAGITRQSGVRYSALVPNMAGLERAIAAGVDDIAVFAAASETFSRRNINKSIQESLSAYAEVAQAALAAGMGVRGYVSTAFGCPFEGAVSSDRVVAVTGALFAMGASEVAISDTIGIAHPGQVRALVETIGRRIPLEGIALHFHDTRGTALVNVYAALDAGITTFDSAAGGLGGCPYAPGAAGNLATEDLVFMLDGLGIATGVDRVRVAAASRTLEPKLGHPLPSRVVHADAASAARRTPKPFISKV